jgi:hypothetical protein
MQEITIPRVGDTVHYYVQFEGDAIVSGPFNAIVHYVDELWAVIPRLDMLVQMPGGLLERKKIRYNTGNEFWLPKS